jgi:hypothetical protein
VKLLIGLMTAAFAVAGMANGADATSKRKKYKDYDYDYYSAHGHDRIYDDRDRYGWYPRDANQLKFGSKIWFEQMEAEGRFGGRRRFGG